jgi:hypothetical protein
LKKGEVEILKKDVGKKKKEAAVLSIEGKKKRKLGFDII